MVAITPTCIDEKVFPFPSAYIGIENEAKEGCPSISIEFDVSFKIFVLAFILSKIETSCNDKPEET